MVQHHVTIPVYLEKESNEPSIDHNTFIGSMSFEDIDKPIPDLEGSDEDKEAFYKGETCAITFEFRKEKEGRNK